MSLCRKGPSEEGGGRAGAKQLDKWSANGWRLEVMVVEEIKVVMVGGAMEERMVEGSREERMADEIPERPRRWP